MDRSSNSLSPYIASTVLALKGGERSLPYSLLVIGGVCLGVSPVVVKAMPLAADVSAFYRVVLSAPLFIAYALSTATPQGDTATANRPPLWLYGLAALLFTADLLSMHVAIRMTNTAIATLFTNCAPFFVGIFGLIGLSDRPTSAFWAALPIALIGTVLLVEVSALASGSNLIGDVTALIAAFFYGAYLVTVRRLKRAGASSSRVMAVVTGGSALLLAPTILFPHDRVLPPDLKSIALLLTLVFVGQVAGQGLVTTALKTLPVTSSSIVLLIQPVVAGPLAWAFLAETLSATQLLGMALVLISIVVATGPIGFKATGDSVRGPD